MPLLGEKHCSNPRGRLQRGELRQISQIGGIKCISWESHERPPHALKGHSGGPACGGVSHKADDIPAPTPVLYPGGYYLIIPII